MAAPDEAKPQGEPPAPAVAAPSIALPKGGGALRGIGEQFTANAATGTGSLTMPIATSPGRAGFGPQLALGYDSGTGNGPFGLGWSLSLPAVTRKTDRGLPRYLDAEEYDVFVLSGTEDLVPDGPDAVLDGYAVRRYRPRTDSGANRIERWSRIGTPADVHWRAVTADNRLTIYGLDDAARIADPLDPGRIFSWLISETRDDLGNAILYRYKAEDGAGVDPGRASERNRGRPDDLRRTANRYLKRIHYGNRTPLLDADGRRPRFLDPAQIERQLAGDGWMFEVVFDYGEHDPAAPAPGEAGPWAYRGDPFSSARAGFEVRTTRLCRRVLMFHHFPAEEGVGRDCLVRSTDLAYADDGEPYARLAAVAQTGYRRSPAGGYDRRSTPPTELGYTPARIGERVQTLEPGSLADLPAGSGWQWVDLHGDGAPGLLSEQAGAWWYKRNLSPIGTGARLAAFERVDPQPLAGLGAGAALLDVGGDGQLDVIVIGAPAPGVYEHDDGEGWAPFRPFPSAPGHGLRDPGTRLVDLDGDGHPDLLVTEDEAFVWYPSLAADGFGPARRVGWALDEEHGPRVVFADPAQSIHIADCTGDGLADIVRVRNGDVCYWPNLGHGRFGAKVAMDDAPVFDAADHFDPGRLRLADVDGSGPVDLVYLHADGIRLYVNRSGNSWGPPRTLPAPRVDDTADIAVFDLLGAGTACLVWSSPLPGDAGRQVQYVDLMAAGKPHLLVSLDNNLGAETRIDYAPSTRFALRDRDEGRPWPTRLPFPVHVVERVTTLDHVNRGRYVTRYAYHHGHYDAAEREFRGFGLVEQWDADEGAGAPPTRTVTRFETGAGPLPDAVLPDGLSLDEEREARRALRGSMLRQEVYGEDGSPVAAVPYTVTEQRFTVRLVRPRGANRHAVFLTHPREALTHHHDRDADDPRVEHTLTLEVDEFGNVLKRAVAAYGRRPAAAGLAALDPPDRARQTTTLVTYTEHRFTNAVATPDTYRTPAEAESTVYELTGFTPTGPDGRFRAADLLGAAPVEVPFEAEPAAGPCRRRVEHLRTVYRRDDLAGLLPLGTQETLALAGDTYKLAFTPGLLTKVYPQPPADVAAALTEGGYVTDPDGTWWRPSGRALLSPGPGDELAHARAHFFRPRRYRDPFGNDAFVDYDADELLLAQTRDALGNTVTVLGNDYRVLEPRLVRDANGNRTELAYDILGHVAGTAVMGKAAPAPVEGDSLAGFVTDPDQAAVDAFLDTADPRPAAAGLLGDATSRSVYDLHRFARTRAAHPDDPAQWQPACSATLARETHAADGPAARIRLAFAYSDGLGREIQRKEQAELGRFVATGWTIFDNKGRPTRRYEPFFGDHRFQFGVEAGVSAVLFYDPANRVVATLHPDHSYDKVVYGPWRHATYDPNDTCAARGRETGDPRNDPDVSGVMAGYFRGQPADWATWHAQRAGGALGPDEQTAAERAAAHADTPAVAHVDPLGRTFLTVAGNRVACPGHDLDGREETVVVSRVDLDIDGNQTAVHDAGRVVMRHAHDLLRNRIHQASMEAGPRWVLGDVAGRPVRGWDGRGHAVRTAYDALRRPVERTVRGSTADSDPRTLNRDVVFERIEYGESVAGAEGLNLRTRIYRQFDGAGVLTHARLDAAGAPVEAYDFKGNPLRVTRRLVAGHRAVADWSAAPALSPESFAAANRYDALNRAVQTVAPHSDRAGATVQVSQPRYTEAGRVDRIDVWLERAAEPADLLDRAAEAPSPVGVTGVQYNARGQRVRVEHGNGVHTDYDHDPATFRLTGLVTTRGADPLQSLRYTYDPAGNITHVRDDAQQAVFFNNRRVEPGNDYVYDALYRLIQAGGREHLGQLDGGAPRPPTPPGGFDAFHTGLDHPGDGAAMGTYLERYVYDNAGNIRLLQHRGSDPAHPGWTRAYDYEEPSALEAAVSNRLTRTTVGATTEAYAHDPHGNLLRLPHLGTGGPDPNLHWDYGDALRQVDRGGGGTAFYAYDSAGQRVRKVWEKAPGLIEERIYLDGFELFRRHSGAIDPAAPAFERETVHVTLAGHRVALVETRTADAAGTDRAPRRLVRYQYVNHLESSALELDEQARIVSYEEYSPYGDTTYQAVRSRTETAKRYRYTGRERDEESGLSYHGARYYAPWLGRWTSADPAGLVDGLNLYCYARCRPSVLLDPTGTLSGSEQEVARILLSAATLKQAADAASAARAVTGAAKGVEVVNELSKVPRAVGGTGLGGSAGGIAGGGFVASQVAASLAMAGAVALHMYRSTSIARYGNPYNIAPQNAAFPVLSQAQQLRESPYPLPEPAPDDRQQRKPRMGRIYVTYTKYNHATGRYYSGRTSAEIDLNKPWRPQAIAAMENRDANHHIEDEAIEPKGADFDPAQLDMYAVGFAQDYAERYRDFGYHAIRGREQQLIDDYGLSKAKDLGVTDFKGGARTDTLPGPILTENKVRGVAKDSLLGEAFHAASDLAFGPLAPYTGMKLKDAVKAYLQ
ncbi:SpvB/TcaC N-terminal domain-containing protein [Dactylosporangium sp. CA-139066]|uniref:SpvB/TcaC N-terminal domain-containing protein n=1 Tax=Dactylosporangium sp. CA-139066 TaxID=3239930 RepID=UPI003D901C59